MKVALITDSIDDASAGVGTYTRGLVKGMRSSALAHQIELVHRREHPFYSGEREIIFPGRGGKFVRKQGMMAAMLEREGFDLVHDTFHFPPFLLPSGFARVMTIHDMTPFLLERRNMEFRNWLWHRLFVPILARRAHHILADSDCTRRDIIRLFRTAPEQVSVAHLAADETFRPQSKEQCDAVRLKYGLPERYLLYLGTIEPRKNLVRVIRSFERAAGDMGETGLVLAGGLRWQADAILAAVESSPQRSRISIPGRIDSEDLSALYSGAIANVYVSLYEGFGLPPLEAMQSGCPVIAANTSSLPEVVGNAGRLVDPVNEEEMAAAMRELVQDRDLRRDLAARGIARARQFNWRHCAEATLQGYDAASARRLAKPPPKLAA